MISINPLALEEKFDPALISALYKNFKDTTTAFLELIDNAVDDIIPGNQMLVTIIVKSNLVNIVQKGGKGMGIEELGNFLVWGQSKKRGLLGRYGQGGKAAIGYLAKSWRIRTTKLSEQDEYVIEEQDWDDRSQGLKKYNPKRNKTSFIDEGLVQIDFWNLKKKINSKELKNVLGDVYSPLVREGKLKITINNEEVKALDIPLEMPEEQFNRVIDINKNIHGWLSFLKSGSHMRGGVRCYEFGRLITDKEYFGGRDSSFKESLNRLIGELYIDFEIPLVMNKTDFDRESSEWKRIRIEMLRMMKPYIELLLEEKEKDIPTEKEKEAIVYAGDKWKDFLQFLKHEQKEGSLPGLPIDRGQKPHEENPSPKVEEHDAYEPNRRIPHEPATPPPHDAIGRRKRTGAFPKPIPQPLPEMVRYQLVEREQEKIMLINTKFPSYKLRKNQLPLYTWETLILEYAKADLEDSQTASEYIEEMSVLLYKLGKYIRKTNLKINS